MVKSVMDIHDNIETGILYKGFPDNEEEKKLCGFQTFYTTNGPGVELPSYLPKGQDKTAVAAKLREFLQPHQRSRNAKELAAR